MSIWNWNLWHKFKTKTTLVKDKPDFIKKMNEKSTDKKSEKKDSDNNDEKDKTI